jgi:hypothetical protein
VSNDDTHRFIKEKKKIKNNGIQAVRHMAACLNEQKKKKKKQKP